MTFATVSHCNRANSLLVGIVAAFGLGACSTTIGPSDRIEYRGAEQVSTLEIPPDLTAPSQNDRFSVSDLSPKGVATYSAYNSERSAAKAPDARMPAAQVVGAEKATSGDKRMFIERAGSQRWLVVQGDVDALWPEVREFWIGLGFVLEIDEPDLGIMETGWAEDRAKIPEGFIRRTIGRVLDNVFSTPERDKFRTRLEVGDGGRTEIFISHRGVSEIYPDEARDRTIWQPRPADPEIEAEMLRRLMLRLGASEQTAEKSLAVAPAPERARLELVDGVGRLSVDDPFDRAWRRVGLALDRTRFAVEDRNRSEGVYFVRYIDPEAENESEGGFLSKLLFWRSDDDEPEGGDFYRIYVAGAGDVSQVSVLTREGGEDRSATAKRILTVLYEQLR